MAPRAGARPEGSAMAQRTTSRVFRSIAALVLAGFVASTCGPAVACTRIVYLGADGDVITARSMDWKVDVGTNLWVFPRGLTRTGEAGPNSLRWTSRFGSVIDVMVAGEGLETMLSLLQVVPSLPAVAALSASHLAALELPAGLRRFYIAQDADPAGRRAAEALADRARAIGVEVLTLVPALDDFNGDLRRLGVEVLSARLHDQLAREDTLLVRST